MINFTFYIATLHVFHHCSTHIPWFYHEKSIPEHFWGVTSANDAIIFHFRRRFLRAGILSLGFSKRFKHTIHITHRHVGNSWTSKPIFSLKTQHSFFYDHYTCASQSIGEIVQEYNPSQDWDYCNLLLQNGPTPCVEAGGTGLVFAQKLLLIKISFVTRSW